MNKRIKNKVKKAWCFTGFMTHRGDSPKAKAGTEQAFRDAMKNNPDERITYTDHTTNREYLYENRKLKCVSLNGQRAVDMELVKQVAQDLNQTPEFKDKYHYAYVLKLLREGQLGEGYGSMTYEQFIKSMNPLDVGQKSNLQEQMPQKEFPRWICYNGLNIDDCKAQKAKAYADDFIARYTSLHAETYGEDINIDEL